LKRDVWEWAEHNIADAKDWIIELSKHKIRSHKALKKVARNEDSWNQLCASVSIVLREELRD
jgi:hypothetical protein